MYVCEYLIHDKADQLRRKKKNFIGTIIIDLIGISK